ncbi:MAG: hypothetical protein GKR89_19515 [Candidatus Latescibacteria bacterium]|nr:hypothetical protein [Candidatus Latescibacterota bacterium]
MLHMGENQALGLAVVGFLAIIAVKSSLLLLVVGGIQRLLKDRSAALRHLAWVLAFGGLGLLPWLALGGPEWPVALPRLDLGYNVAQEQAPGVGRAPSKPVLPSTIEPASGAAVILPISATDEVGVPPMQERSATALKVSMAEPVRSYLWKDWTRRGPWALVLLWAVGVGVVWFRLARGVWQRRHLVAAAIPVQDPSWHRLAVQWQARLGVARPVRLVQHAGASMPVTWGYWKPVILLPAQARTWSAGCRRAVLVHELGHIKRADQWIQSLAQLICALYWFQPLAWWAYRCLRDEQERACDDLVLRQGGRASEYAENLIEIARAVAGRGAVPQMAVPIARSSQMSERIGAILDEGLSRVAPSRRLWLVAMFLAWGVVLPLAALHAADEGQIVHEAMGLNTEQVQETKVQEYRLQADIEAAVAAVVGENEINMVATEAALETQTSGVEVEPEILVNQAESAPRQLDGKMHAMTELQRGQNALTPRMPAGQVWRNSVQIRGDTVMLDLSREMFGDGTFELQEQYEGLTIEESYAEGEYHLRVKEGKSEWRFEAQGDVAFAADENTVRYLSADAFLLLSEEKGGLFGKKKRIKVIPGNDGNPVYTWEVEGADAATEDQAPVWFGEALAVWLDHSSVMTPGRTARLLRQGGTEAFFAAVKRLARGQVLQAYCVELINYAPHWEKWSAQAGVAVAERLLKEAGRIHSSSGMAHVLVVYLEANLGAPPLSDAFFATLKRVDSDSNRAYVLLNALALQQLNGAQAERLLEAASKVGSDSNTAQVLHRFVEVYRIDQELPAAFFRVVDQFDSDSNRLSVLIAALGRSHNHPRNAERILNATAEMASDSNTAQMLHRFIETYSAEQVLPTNFWDVVQGIGSDSNRTLVLRAVLRRPGLSVEEWGGLLTAVATIGSDSNKSAILLELVGQDPVDLMLPSAFFNTVGTIDSDTNFIAVYEALLKQRSVDRQTALAILNSISSTRGQIDMNGSAAWRYAEFLIKLAAKVPMDNELKNAYRQAAYRIESGKERDRALAVVGMA